MYIYIYIYIYVYVVPLFSTSFAVNPAHSFPSIVSKWIPFAVVESLSLPILHLFQFTRSRLKAFGFYPV